MRRTSRLAVRFALGLSLLATAMGADVRPAFAQTSVCTVVKLTLAQTAALEREAFNATLVLTNNQADAPLSNLSVTISIKDASGKPADVLFFNKVTDLGGVSAVDGSGTMQPASQATISWLIVPSPGAGATASAGTKYNVSAQISYVAGGVPSTNATQDAGITVYPQPLLSIEYALPFEVFGVDPFTLTGSTEPFPLGLRVTNVGAGTANNFQVTTAQPKITDNKQGLPINFQILGTFVGSNPLSANSLTLPFGNIAPGVTSLAAWQMTSSYSGRFIDFTVGFTHAASLGGALTSLIQGVSTYTLIKDVLDDQPGHDTQFDLLVNTTTPRSQMEAGYQNGLEPQPDSIMESDSPGLVPVKNIPAHLTGALSGSNAVVSFAYDQSAPTNTWVHSSIPFPQGKDVTLVSVSRSDGKVINPRNAWIAKHIDKLTNTRTYFLHVLDYSSAQSAAFSMAFNAASLVTPPDPISNLSAAATTPGGLTLNWNATGAAGSTGTIVGGQYAIFASTDLAATPSVASVTVVFSTATPALAAQSYLLSGLLGNATYQVTVFLANSAGQFSAASNKIISQTLANPPAAVQIATVAPTGFALYWSDATNSTGTQYQILLSSIAGAAGSVQTAFAANLTSAAFSGLAVNKTYYASAVERNSAQALTPTAVIAAVTTLALPPGTTAPAFVGVSTGGATALWLAGGNPSDTEFIAELSTSPTRTPVIATSGWVRSSSFTFAGLLPATTYYGQVKARNRAPVETAYADLGTIKTAPVDNMPPRTSLVAGSPQFGASPIYIAASTVLSLAAVDDKVTVGDGLGLGVAQTFFAVDSSSFAAYSGTFTLVAIGTHTIQFYSVDVLGNTEVARSTQVAVAAPPAAVADLFLAAVNPSSVTLRWSAPVSTVPLASYDLRRAIFPITAANFAAAIPIPTPVPPSSGTVQSLDVSSVTESAFYAAVVSRDVLGGVSPLSNVAGLTRSTVTVNGLPELAFSANQPVTAALLSPTAGKGAVALASAAPSGLILVSSIYDLGPEGAAFTPNAALTIRHSTAALTALGLVPTDLLIYQYVTGSGWVALSTQTLNASAQSVAASVPSLASVFALLGKSHVPPNLTLTPADGVTVTTTTPRIAAFYSAIGPGVSPATVRLTLDGTDATAAAVVTASTASFVPAAALAQGSHTVTATAADYAGNVATATVTFLVDSIPPQTTLVVGTPQFSSSTLFTTASTPLNFAVTKPARTFFAVDGSTFAAYSGTFTLVALGTHTIQFYSVDRPGNVEVVRSSAVAVDGLPPRTAVAFGDPKFAGARLYLSSATPVLFSEVDDLAVVGDGHGAGVAQTLLSIDSAPFAAIIAAVSLSSEGVHALNWFSRDQVGNTETAASTSVAVDLTPPLTQLLISTPSVAQASGTVVGPATVLSLSAQDPFSGGVASGVKDTNIAVSTGVFALAPGTFTLTGADGPRAVSYYSRDNVLNAEAVKTAAVLLDATPPVSAATIGAPSFVAVDGTQYVAPTTPLTLTAVDPVVNGAASGVDHIEVAVDGAPFAVYTASLTFTEGRHTVQYRAMDRVGNVEAARTLKLQSDATAPVTAFQASGSYYTASGRNYAPLSFAYALAAQDPVVNGAASGVAATQYRVDSGSFTHYISTISLTEGVRQVSFQSADNVGNQELLKSATVYVDATAPVTALSIGQPQYAAGGTLFVGPAAAFALAAQDPAAQGVASGVGAVSVRVDSSPFSAYGATFTLTAVDGVRTVGWFATDNVGNAETPKVSAVALDATPPVTSLQVAGGRQFPGPDASTFYASSYTRLVLISTDPVANGVASGVASTRWQDNGGAFQVYASSLTLAEGAHKFGYQSADNVQNLEALRSTNVWVDATPPVSAFAFGAPYYQAPDGTNYATPATPLTFTAKDPALPSGQPGSGVSRVEVAVDGGAFTVYTASLTFVEGRHVVLYRAIDNVGNIETARTLNLQSDATPPLTALAVQGGHQFPGPDALSFFASADTRYALPAVDPVVKNVASGVASTRWQDNGGAFQAFSAAFALAEGAHHLAYQSQDNVANIEVPRSTTALVDATPPVTSLLIAGGRQYPGPDAVTFYASSDTRLVLISTDPMTNGVASGVAFTRWQDNNGAFQTYASSLTLVEGAHKFAYQSADNVANLEVLRSTNAWIDATPPVTTVSIGSPTFTAADGTIYVATTTPISFAATDPSLPTGQPGSGLNHVETSLDGAAFAPYAAPLTLAEGRHTILYRAIDNVGNAESAHAISIQSDATPPVSALVIGQPRFQLPNVLLVSSRTPFSIAVVDPVTNAVAAGVKDTYYRVSDVAPSTAVFTAFAAPFAMTGADVNKVVEFFSRDNVLDTEIVKSSTVLLDSTPPEVALLSPAACESGICRVLKGKFPVLGTARDLHFGNYVLDYAPGQNATAGFMTISSGTAAVNSGALGTWDASALNGWQSLRLTAADLVANVSLLTINVFVGDPGELLTLGNHEVFDMPEGVAVGGDGKIYVADRDNSRIAVFSSTGALLASFGSRGHDDDDHRLSTGTLRLHEPSGVAVDAAGNIYVADTDRDRVLKLSATGQILLNLDGRVRELEGQHEGKFEDHGRRLPGRFHHPAGVAVDAAQNIYVADTENRRVQVFSSTGGFNLQFDLPLVPARPDRDDDTGQRGDHDDDAGIANLGKPFGISLDAANNIYIADPKGGRALKFGATGQLLLTIPITGDKPGSMGQPFGVAVSTGGNCLLVSDRKYSRILKFDFLGSQNLSFGSKGKVHDDDAPAPSGTIVFKKPVGLALDAAGDLFVADRNNDRVRKFALPTGQPPLVVPTPKPEDEHVARDVVDTEDGGTVERKDLASVAIPAGAVAQDMKVTVSTPTAGIVDESNRQHAVDAAQLKTASPPVEYGPEGTKFAAPVTLTLPYSPDLVALEGVDEADLTVRYWNRDKAQWENLDSTVDAKAHTVKAKTTHFSLYQVFSGTAAASALKPLAAADPTFMYHDAYAFPNPVRGTSVVTIRMQTGLADSVEVRAYDVSGRKVYSSSNFSLNPGLDDGNGKGIQYTYDNVWDISGIGSGVYTYVITARKAGASDIHKTGRVGVIK